MSDLISSLQESKAAKKSKSKKKNSNNKPIKVVYISNPMKVKTSASKFRALVQKLTGQYAEFPDPKKFTDADDGGGENQTVPDAAKNSNDDHAQVVPVGEQLVGDHHNHHHDEREYSTRRASDQEDVHGPFETFDVDEVFTPQMLENFTGFLPSAPGLLL